MARPWLRRARGTGLALLLVLALLAGSVAGATLALRSFGETTGHLALGTVTIGVRPPPPGRAEGFMPPPPRQGGGPAVPGPGGGGGGGGAADRGEAAARRRAP